VTSATGHARTLTNTSSSTNTYNTAQSHDGQLLTCTSSISGDVRSWPGEHSSQQLHSNCSRRSASPCSLSSLLFPPPPMLSAPCICRVRSTTANDCCKAYRQNMSSNRMNPDTYFRLPVSTTLWLGAHYTEGEEMRAYASTDVAIKSRTPCSCWYNGKRACCCFYMIKYSIDPDTLDTVLQDYHF